MTAPRARASSPRPWPVSRRPIRVVLRILRDICAPCGGMTMWTVMPMRGAQIVDPPEVCEHCDSSDVERRTAGVLWAAAGRVVLVRGDPNAW